jgi:hypothetical protein
MADAGTGFQAHLSALGKGMLVHTRSYCRRSSVLLSVVRSP